MLIIDIILFLFFICFGACIGSFISMFTYRLPINEDIVLLDSYCPKCGNQLKKKSLIPIVSYFLQKGKCLSCGKSISFRYPLIEIVNTLAYSILFLIFGFSFKLIFLCLFFSLILSIIVVDLEHMEIPLYFQYSLLVFSVVHIIFNYEIDPLLSIISSLVYFFTAELARIIVEKYKPNMDVLGGGDTKIIALSGLLLGLNNIALFLFLTGAIGLIFGLIWSYLKKAKIFPFAPAIMITLFLLLSRYYLNLW